MLIKLPTLWLSRNENNCLNIYRILQTHIDPFIFVVLRVVRGILLNFLYQNISYFFNVNSLLELYIFSNYVFKLKDVCQR